MGLIDECSQYFGCSTLYEVLSIDKNATDADVKKAFRKASLLLHPDKVKDGEKEEATRKFQTLSKVYYILSDKDRRACYDETGVVDGDSVPDESPESWMENWRALFPRTTVADIEKFFKTYTGSDEELKDLQECYEKHEGSMDRISKFFIGYQVEEEDRIRNIIEGWIEEGRVQAYPKFVNEKPAKRTARVRKAKKEAAEAKLVAESDYQALATAMQQRAQDRKKSFNSLISSLEEKYCNEKPKESKKMKRRP